MDLKTYATLQKLKNNSDLLEHVMSNKTLSITDVSEYFKPLLDSQKNDDVSLLVEDYPNYLAKIMKLRYKQIGNDKFEVSGEINDRLLETIRILSNDNNHMIIEKALNANTNLFGDHQIDINHLSINLDPNSNVNLTNFNTKQDASTDVKQNVPTDAKQDAPTDVKQDAPTDVKQDASTDVKQDASTDVKQDVSTDAKQDADTNVKQDVSTDAKQDADTDVKQDVSTDSKQDAPTDSKQDVSTDTKQDADTDSKQDADTDSKQDVPTDAKQDAPTDTKQDVSTDSKQNTDSKKDATTVETKPAKKELTNEQRQLAYDQKVANTLREAMHYLLQEIKKYKLHEQLPGINTNDLMVQ